MNDLKHIEYTPSGVCSRKIEYDLSNDGKIYNLTFTGGCPGNLKAISKLVNGMDAKEVANLLLGNTCGYKQTSCTDQLSKSILEALNEG